MPFDPIDQQHMERALELARKALGETRPNPHVGAVIVKNGRVIGEGFHARAGLLHAEREALGNVRERGEDPRGATMYVTLEPCNHTGRTPPCTEAVLEAGIARVVIAQDDPHATAAGGAQRLRAAGLQVEIGLCRGEALLLNAAFNTSHLLGRPLVTLKWAMTLDGCTSTETGDSMWITGCAARQEVHRRRALHHAILVGSGTLLKDAPKLTVRLEPMPRGPRLLRCAISPRLEVSLDAPLLTAGEEGDRPLLFCRQDADPVRQGELEAAGADVARLPPDEKGRIDLRAMLAELHRRHIQSLYVEGGRTLAGSFLEAGLVDRVEAYIAPRLLGGGRAHLGPLRRPDPLNLMAAAEQLHHVQMHSLAPDWLMEGWLTGHLFPEECEP